MPVPCAGTTDIGGRGPAKEIQGVTVVDHGDRRVTRGLIALGEMHLSVGRGTVEASAMLRGAVGQGVQVNASGGIRTVAAVVALVRAGADRIRTSASVAILGGLAGTNV